MAPRAHEIMREAFENKTIRIITDFGHLNRAGSPVYSPWDNVAPLLLMVIVSLGLMLIAGLIIGTAALVLSAILYAFGVRAWLAQRVHQRTVEAMLLNPHNWQVLWEYGGIVVTVKERKGLGVVAPDGDWITFALNSLPESQEGGRAEADEPDLAGFAGPPEMRR